MDYKGYVIDYARGSGKAVTGYKKTCTVQVKEPWAKGYLLLKQIRFTVGDRKSLQEAGRKALRFVDELVAKKG